MIILSITPTPVVNPFYKGGEESLTLLFLKTIIALGIVIVISIIFLRVVMPKIYRTRFTRGTKNIEVIDFYNLAPKKQLFIIKVINRYLLIGVSENNINLICELTDVQDKLKKPFTSSKPFSFWMKEKETEK